MPYICKGVTDYMNRRSLTFVNGILPLTADLVGKARWQLDSGMTNPTRTYLDSGKGGQRRLGESLADQWQSDVDRQSTNQK